MDEQTSVGLWRLVVIGCAAGLLGGFFGVGGGIILVPLLVAAGVDRHRAHATSLASFMIIATAGAISFGISGAVDLPAAIAVGTGGIVGGMVGATLMHRMSTKNLAILFGVVLAVAGLRMLFGADPLPGTAEFAPIAQLAFAVGIGLVSGLFAGLAGIGGGVVIVPAAVLLLGLDQHVAQGTSLAAIVLTAISGSVINLRNDRVRLRDAFIIGLGGVIGSVVGSRIALGLEGQTLAFAFGLLVIFVSIRTLYRATRLRSAQSSVSSSDF